LNFSDLHSRLPKRSLLFISAGLFLLSFFSAFYFKVQPSIQHQQKLLQNYISEQQKEARQLLRDSSLMRKLVLKAESGNEFNRLYKKEFGLFLFAETISDNQDLLFWNNQKILPPVADFTLKDGDYFQRLANGYYLVTKATLHFSGMSNNIIAYVLIPVLNQFYVETDYLTTSFVHSEDAINKISIAGTSTKFPIKSLSGAPLFYIKEVSHPKVPTADLLTIVLRLTALILLFIYTGLLADSIARKKRPLYGVLFLMSFIIFRLLIYQSEDFFSLRRFGLFNPAVYAVNYVNSSLGDLLINSVLLCWIVLFTWYTLSPDWKMPSFLKGLKLYAVGFVAIFALIFATFQFANTVRNLVAESKVSFDVTNFFSLDIFYTTIGFIILALLSLTYYYFTRLLFRFIFSAFKDNYVYIYFCLAFIGLLFLTFRSGNSIVLFHLPVLMWLVVYTLLVSQEKFFINRFRITVMGAVFWIFVFSVSLAAIILQGNRVNELRVRKAIAEKYDRITDPTTNYQLSIAINGLNNRFLLNNFNRFKDPSQNRFLKDSILKEIFADYNIKYDTKIYVFDSLNRAINNEDSRSYAELNTLFSVQSKPTGIIDLNYLETSFDRITYITRRTVKDSIRSAGTFFVISNPRQYGSDALYPELFRQVSKRDDENSPIYSYGIYKNGLLTLSSNKYPFQISIPNDQIPKSEIESRTNGDYDELWYRANNNKIVVIARKRDSLLESITLFSYLFCAFLFMVGLLQLMSVILRLFRDRASFNLFAQSSIRSQIQGTIIFISILSFLIIGVATISFFIERYNRNNIDKLSRTAGIMVKELEKRLNDTAAFNTQLSDSASFSNLQRLVDEVADIHNADVNVYNLDGNLQVSSENEVYDKGILSKQMHPLAYYHLSRMREVQRVQKERLSSLDYWSIYTSVRNSEGQVVQYLNVPYFSSQIDLKQEISNFLVTIINLNAFIFLIAGIIALFITNKITQSFSVIGDKMRAIRLGKTNEEIIWNKNDEIGELVKQYNKMVNQLEQSAEALARSEREGAWREMARQVAHEIKNPLTPMKLSIQYLQKAIDTNQHNVKELTAGVANTLIEQIDHLSKIAADFSQFANIGNKKIELVDLHQVIGILVDLYSSNPKVNIEWNKIFGSVVMKADKTHMNRVFTNLLANAVDACQDKRFCDIKINEVQDDGVITISVEDNGEGIPEEMRSKIFTPNFTTKTSGTGLGLAMTKSIVEQAKGNIWFETEEGKGTTFFVQLPVIN
jgi:two-component system, NtrC family, nitrogen regulation sensor histidine kinase NtrY